MLQIYKIILNFYHYFQNIFSKVDLYVYLCDRILNFLCCRKKQQELMTEKEIYILIGKKIQNLRFEKGLTQQQVADMCEFEKASMSRIESGRTNLTVKNLFKISQSLGVEMKDLVDI
jgi:DNA-binding XRE family transcriptional regulator